MKKNIINFIFYLAFTILLIPFCNSQDCLNLPNNFYSKDEALRFIKSSTFEIYQLETYDNSWIRSASYFSCNRETGYLIIKSYDNEYIHEKVPISIWKEISNTASIGEYYNNNVKGRFLLELKKYTELPSREMLDSIFSKCTTELEFAYNEAMGTFFTTSPLNGDHKARIKVMLDSLITKAKYSPETQYAIGDLYNSGRAKGHLGLIEVDADSIKAFSWYNKAFRNGYKEASYDIANFYYDGNYSYNSEKDMEQAIHYYLICANEGNKFCMNKLSKMYRKGEGTFLNYAKAFFWAEKAALEGNADAYIPLGLHYYYGLGTPENRKNAAYWVKKTSESRFNHAAAREIWRDLGLYSENSTVKKQPNDSTSSNLDFLKQLNGRYPHEVNLFDNSAFTRRLKHLLGKNRYEYLQAIWVVESQIEITDNIFVAKGCQAHMCAWVNSIIVVDFSKNVIYAGIRDDDEVTTYSEDGYSSAHVIEWENGEW